MIDLRDPATVEEYRRIRNCAHRQILKNGREKRGFLTTVGAVAKSCRLTPEKIVEFLDDAYLVILTKSDGDWDGWLIEEDGE